MKEGDIILAAILQFDGKFKKRPALILKELPKYGDLLICGISSQVHQFIEGFDLLINKVSADFKSSGLIVDSVIRLGFLSVIPKNYCEGKLGAISEKSYKELISRLCNYLLK